MEFDRIIGKIDSEAVAKAEAKLSSVFLNLALRPDNIFSGDGLGGDPLLFALLQPVSHVATLNIPTAATDGKRYYWNLNFVNKLSPIGLRMVCGHEAWHAIYMHPQRRGDRIPKLWNICVDYIVNNLVMDDLSFRKKDSVALFKEHLGNFLTVAQYAEVLKNPFAPLPGMEKEFVSEENKDVQGPSLPKADEERELTDQEKEEIERQEKRLTFFYADPELDANLKSPEKLYDFFYNLLPKCPECGRVGLYKIPKDKKKPGSKDEETQELPESKEKSEESEDSKDSDGSPDSGAHDHSKQGSGNQSSPCNHGCNTCGSNGDGSGEGDEYIDIFGFGGTLDDHMDASESPEKMGQRLADAIETAKRMAGHIPAGLQDELGQLTAPIVKWKDVVRAQQTKSRDGNSKNDWTRFRSRPMFAGLMVPKRIDHLCKFVTLLDCSGSMNTQDIAYGVSQLQSLDQRDEGVVVPADSDIYWDKATRLKNTSREELLKINIYGGGGTIWASFFRDYEKKVGKADFLIVITDGYLMDQDVAEMRDPGIPVFWLITSTCAFQAPFGKCYYLRG